MNKKFWYLDDLVWLYEQLRVKSMSQLAKELAATYKDPWRSIYSSIRFRVHRYMSDREIATLFRQRAFHKNNKV